MTHRLAPRGSSPTFKTGQEIRIEHATCGLRISDSPTSNNLTPQETTNQNAPDMGPEEAGLSSPGSNVVAEGARFENPTAPETIDLDLLPSVRSKLLTEESK